MQIYYAQFTYGLLQPKANPQQYLHFLSSGYPHSLCSMIIYSLHYFSFCAGLALFDIILPFYSHHLQIEYFLNFYHCIIPVFSCFDSLFVSFFGCRLCCTVVGMMRFGNDLGRVSWVKIKGYWVIFKEIERLLTQISEASWPTYYLSYFCPNLAIYSN